MIPHIYPVLSDSQHGFIKQRSTSTNLFMYTHEIASHLDVGGQVDAIYTDFAKAFDRVDHGLLLCKLQSLHLPPTLISWFSTYLLNRPHIVSYQGQKSFVYHSTSGIPQGSNLGPLLFLIFINDAPFAITHSSCLLYADDLKIYRPVLCHNDSLLLQEDLDGLTTWCELNNLFLNIKKCQIISFSRRQQLETYDYHINGQPLMRSDSVKDLGVWYDSKLSFNKHVLPITSSSLKILGLITRCSRNFSKVSTIITLFNLYVGSKLEYFFVIWYRKKSSV